MPFDSIEVGPLEVVLEYGDPVLSKAKRIALFELTMARIGVVLFTSQLVRVIIGVSSKTDSIAIFIILLVSFSWQTIVFFRAYLRLRKGVIKKRIRVEPYCVVEEYSFDLLGRSITKKTKSKDLTKVVMHYNQVFLSAGDSWNMILGYDLFSSRERMKSYANAVCEKAGIELQFVEGVA